MDKTFKLNENIDKFLKYMSFIKTASPLTVKHYQIDLNQAFNSPPEYKTKSNLISEKELLAHARQAFQFWADLSLASKNRKASTLKSFFTWAFNEKLTEQNLSLFIMSPKVPKKIPHFISVDEALAVLHSFGEKSDQDEQLLKEKVLFLIIYGGGLRVSEACHIKWIDVNFEKKVIRVLGKGNKERLIALPRLAFKSLKNWQKENGKNLFVFGERPLNTRTAYNMVKKSGQRAMLLKPLHPHALRHSFATHLLSSGANLRTLQELLGHESLQATEKYTHLGIDQLARTMENMHPLGKGRL